MTTRRPRTLAYVRLATLGVALAVAAGPQLASVASAAPPPAPTTAPDAPAGAAPADRAVDSAVDTAVDTSADEPMPTGGVIVRFKDGTDAAISSAARDRALDAVGSRTASDLAAEQALGTGATLVTGATPARAKEVADTLQARADVAYAEPDVRFRVGARHAPAATRLPATAIPLATALAIPLTGPLRLAVRAAAPNDPLWSYQWDLSSARFGIDAQSAWPRTRGAGVTVAVVDTGIIAHPDLAGQVLPGYDFISDPWTARDGNGRDADPTDRGDWLVDGDCGGSDKATDSTWHGTHVAGTIAATASNGEGIAGVAPGARILPVRAVGRCGGSLVDIADGVTWATGGRLNRVPRNANPARVVNLSLGGAMTCPATLQAAIDGANSRGALVVAAAGNSAVPAEREAPGNCRGVINVAATTGTGARANYSNYGRAVTLSAPGGQSDRDGILSTIDGGRRTATGPDYGFMIGTSMAAPHVSGVAALLLSTAPGLSAAQVRSVLTSSARPLGAACSGCGAGIVDAGRAVAAVRGQARTGAKSTTGTTPATDGPGSTSTPTTTKAAPVLDRTPIPDSVQVGPRARLAWAPFAGARGDVRYTVQWRPITLDGATRRYGDWAPVATGTTDTSIWAGGVAGGVYQFRVRGTDSAGVTSAWATPSTVTIPADLTARIGTWRGAWNTDRQSSAVSGTLRTSTARGASVTLPATHASGVAVVAATGPTGGVFDIVVNGKRVQRVNTTSDRPAAARTVATVRLPYGRQTVRLVRVAGTVGLDAIAYLR